MNHFPFPSPAATEMGARKAALVLHSLRSSDREWMLQRLGPAPREAVQPWLEELEQLGIPADRGLVDEVLAIGEGSAKAESDRQRRLLEDAAPAELGVLLAGEPAALVGRLLSSRTWSWRDGFMKQLSPADRGEIVRAQHACEREGNATPRAQIAALLQALELRLNALPEVRHANPSLLSRWKAAMPRLDPARIGRAVKGTS
jgi:hypothetical protein